MATWQRGDFFTILVFVLTPWTTLATLNKLLPCGESPNKIDAECNLSVARWRRCTAVTPLSSLIVWRLQKTKQRRASQWRMDESQSTRTEGRELGNNRVDRWMMISTSNYGCASRFTTSDIPALVLEEKIERLQKAAIFLFSDVGCAGVSNFVSINIYSRTPRPLHLVYSHSPSNFNVFRPTILLSVLFRFATFLSRVDPTPVLNE